MGMGPGARFFALQPEEELLVEKILKECVEDGPNAFELPSGLRPLSAASSECTLGSEVSAVAGAVSSLGHLMHP